MSEAYGEILESGTIRFVRLLPGPIERVWAYLVEPEKRELWFAGGAFELWPGGEARLLFRHSQVTDEEPPEAYREMHESGVWSSERILRCEPPHVLSFTWSEPGEAASEVTFELSAQGEAVRLVLTHRRIGSPGLMQSFGSGWHLHLGMLEDVLMDRRKRGFWSRLARLEADYAERIAGRSDRPAGTMNQGE